MRLWKGRSAEEPSGPPDYAPHQIDALEEALAKAHSLGQELDWQGMAEQLRATLEGFPGDPSVLCWLGVAECELGLGGVAYERFKQCLQAQPEDPTVLATAGHGLARFDDPGAEPALRTAALIAPELARARWLYGSYLIREGLLEQGLQELQAAREIEPDNPEITEEIGVALALQGNHEGAIDELYRATELGNDAGWTAILLGLALLEEDRLDEAVAELVRGARESPDDVEGQMLASLAAAREGMDDLAWEMLERARQVADGVDLALAEEVAGALDRGAEEASDFLRAELAPASYRSRLRERP